MKVHPPWLLAASLVLGCAMAPPQIGEPGAELPDRQQEAAYQAVMTRFSDHREIYTGVETEMFTGATYQSASFREARLRRMAVFQLWPPGKLEPTLAQELAEASQAHEIVFGVSLANRKFDDFDARVSIWRLSLSTSQGEVTPLSVRRIGRADANFRSYYPYLGDFWNVYLVRFPVQVGGAPLVVPGTPSVTFRMASTQAQVVMEFPVQ